MHSLLVVGNASAAATGGGGSVAMSGGASVYQFDACAVVTGAVADKPTAKMDLRQVRDALNSPPDAAADKLGEELIARRYANASA
jgi:hypothetical protein